MSFNLENIKIVEASQGYAAPMCVRLFADLGADIIWIRYAKNKPMNATKALNRLVAGSMIESDVNYFQESVYRNKRGMTLDFSSDEGREIIYRMVENSDVFLSNFRPRQIEKWKLDYETLAKVNPKIVTAQLTGYGKKGPDKDLPGYEGNGFYSRSGLFHVLKSKEGVPPQSPYGVGDTLTGLALAWGIAIALYVREQTGVGQEVDTSLFQAGVFAGNLDITGALLTGQDRQPVEPQEQGNALMNWYRTRDNKWVRFAIAATDHYWPVMCDALEIPHLKDDPRFNSFNVRIDNHVELYNLLDEVLKSRTLAEWKPRFDEFALLWAPVQTLPEVANDPQARANDFFVPFDHPKHGKLEFVGHPVSYSKTKQVPLTPAPEFNQHTEEILIEYGYSADDIIDFREKGVIA
ncbi:MAG: CoA transferase [Deltaproteobacteria bacterium]|jgi:crotonobetainyl-CoA:carnitine CoA-transferase CaiB-like acyl-CoA transferase|nr:CoA transferase [Deltaproteobacteria bacterium]MBT4638849.1 CoA transferase [Deltaproteobacteria bacterium]MBT6502744.1 CoA transferase [Deltaproteobacteria bacterium]MBT6612435.1 CoA transferase [Deltaproteobacteria bacterium]MBT7152857.1 CoA transferase [Deltaproteobacteria bacterium]